MSSPVFGTEISVLEGTSVTLVCTYHWDKKLETCWGRSCGSFPFTDPIKENKSKYKINAEVGTVNLTILKLQPRDRGSYCCRVKIPGWFNDLKQFYSLRVVKGKCCSLHNTGYQWVLLSADVTLQKEGTWRFKVFISMYECCISASLLCISLFSHYQSLHYW